MMYIVREESVLVGDLCDIKARIGAWDVPLCLGGRGLEVCCQMNLRVSDFDGLTSGQGDPCPHGQIGNLAGK